MTFSAAAAAPLRALVLLLMLLSAAGWAQDVVFSPRSIVVNPKPGFDVRVELNKGSGEQIPTYAIGEQIRIGVSVSQDAYVYLFDIKSNGQVQQILPNRYDEAGRDNYVRANQTKYFPPRDASYTFNVEGPRGLDKVIAVASQNQLDTAQLAQFSSSGQFATSNLGEEGFAQGLSIVVKPIAQQSWVTATTPFYIGDAVAAGVRGTAEVHLESRPNHAEVTVDGRPLGRTPLDLTLGVGRHEFVLRHGKKSETLQLWLREGESRRLTVRLGRD